jgi:DNA-3-methyladenine glycosylase
MPDVDRDWLARPPLEVAPELLGCVIVRVSDAGVVAVRLTEVEAYQGADDPGSHAYRGQTARNAVMFGPAGHLYVYFTYGMHWCANVVCSADGQPGAVLLRAGEVVDGVGLARQRRPSARADRELARGPARLAAALGLGRDDNGTDVCRPDARVRLIGGGARPASKISSGPRVGLANGADRHWRFWLDGEPSVSAYRAHQPRARKPARHGAG